MKKMISDNHRRMVIFAGPHKSASSSVQELFMKYASSKKKKTKNNNNNNNNDNDNETTKHPSLENWTWPWNPRRRSYLPRKGFAPLVTEEIGFHRLIWDTILEVWNATTNTTMTTTTTIVSSSTTTTTNNETNWDWIHPHLIWGTEELDRFGSVPWSGRNGLVAMKKVWDLTHPSQLDIVVNYRRPRRDQWISIWKQLMRKQEETKNSHVGGGGGGGEGSYTRFLCDKNEYTRIWEYLDCVANPLGFVQALLEFWMPYLDHGNVTIHLLDMNGIATMQRDVGHVLACDILGVPCTADHWLPNIQRPILQNVKSGHPGLTDPQLDDMEWILRQRDCSFQQRLSEFVSSTPHHLVLHYADTLWDACPKESNTDSLSKWSTTTYLLELLQSQVGCGNLSSKNAISTLREQYSMGNHFGNGTLHSISKEEHVLDNPKNVEKSIVRISNTKPKSGGSDTSLQSIQQNESMIQAAKNQLMVLYFLLVVMVAFLFRTLKCRGVVPQRSWTSRNRRW